MVENTDKEKIENTEDMASNELEQEDVSVKESSEEVEGEEDLEAEEELDELEKAKIEVQEAKDKYIRLYSEFENFRRRTAKERLELINTASEDLIVALLPVMDDFERAQKALEESEDHKASQEGFELIFNKFSNILKQKGLKAMETETGSEFNTEYHEAISQMPVEKKKMKGKVFDVVEKGYMLDEKVIRFAKVVIGA